MSSPHGKSTWLIRTCRARSVARWRGPASRPGRRPCCRYSMRETPHDSFSGILLGLVATFVVDRHGLDRETVDAWAASMRELDTDWFFSLNRYVFLATRASAG